MSAVLKPQPPRRSNSSRRSTLLTRRSATATPPIKRPQAAPLALTNPNRRPAAQTQPRLVALPGSASPRQVSPSVRKLPTTRSLPMGLRLLMVVERSSAVTTFLLVAAVLAVYGWTVHLQNQWNRQYTRLNSLQHEERQLTATNELLKNQLAQQAQTPEAGLVQPSPSDTVFLEPSPPRVAPTMPETTAVPQSAPNLPLGY